jgi:DNA-directed RNA polymerases I, II, and III subunit RPABC2
MNTDNNSSELINDDAHDNNNELHNLIFSVDDLKEKLKSKDRITKPFLTKYERARIIGYRAEQIASGTVPCVDISNLTNAVEIANKELTERKLPLVIKRTLPNNDSEYWKLEELDINI